MQRVTGGILEPGKRRRASTRGGPYRLDAIGARSGELPPAHLYAHIPFCSAKCPYCAFVTHVGSLRLVEPYLAALEAEAAMLAAERPGGPLATVYFGGGTPSLLTPDQVARLLDTFHRLFGFQSDCEITLEAHPGSVDEERLRGYAQAGISRVSIGVESLQAGELVQLGRTHTAGDGLRALRAARAAGIPSVNLDLMYGIPGQTLASWRGTLGRLVRARPDHVSLYPLSIEPKTVFRKRWLRNMLEVPEDEQVAQMYLLAAELLRASGYRHYEVANWARPGHQCRHNLAYWERREVYAIGAGAHGYLHPNRTENMSRTSRYIATALGGSRPVEISESIDATAELNEIIMLGLRLLERGLDTRAVSTRFGFDLRSARSAELELLHSNGLVTFAGDRLLLAEEAVLVANEVWSRLIM